MSWTGSHIAHVFCILATCSLSVVLFSIKKGDAAAWLRSGCSTLNALCAANYQAVSSEAHSRICENVQKRRSYQPLLELYDSQKATCDSLLENASFGKNHDDILDWYWKNQPPHIVVDGAPIFHEDFREKIPKALSINSIGIVKKRAWKGIVPEVRSLDLMKAHRWYAQRIQNSIGSTIISCWFGCDLLFVEQKASKVGFSNRIKLGFVCGNPEYNLILKEILLNDEMLPRKDGRGIFQKSFSSSGYHELKAKIVLEDRDCEHTEEFTQETIYHIYVEGK